MRALALFVLSSVAVMAQEATLAVVNARVWTGDAAVPWAEAVAVSGKRITVVGSNAEVWKITGARTQVIDAKGRLVTPGFIDSHVHALEAGFRLSSVQLRTAAGKQDFIDRIRRFAARVPPGSWITGGDWDHTNWGGELPTRDWLDRAAPDNPVWVNRVDGHMALANSRALQLAGIGPDTPDPEGGTIVRDESGRPTGLLKDNAMSLVNRVQPQPSAEQYDRALTAAMKYLAERGVTSVHHMGSWADLAALERARKARRLTVRVYAAVPLQSWERLRDKIAQQGRGDEWLRIGNLKGFADGSLGSHTAAMLEGFEDAPNERGLLVTAPEKLYQWISGAAKAGLHVSVHAIGDRAIRTQLDIYERIEREQALKDPRFRIEHSQHISPADLPRFAKGGVIASMQPYHCIDDGRWAESVIGPERAKGTYAFRSLLDSGATVAFGSDWPVAPATPLEGIYAAVTRRTLDDKHPNGWVPEQSITVEEAIRCYTQDAAFASFEEDNKGMLRRGKLADFVIIDRDLTEVPPQEIRDARISVTVVGGHIVYKTGP